MARRAALTSPDAVRCPTTYAATGCFTPERLFTSSPAGTTACCSTRPSSATTAMPHFSRPGSMATTTGSTAPPPLPSLPTVNHISRQLANPRSNLLRGFAVTPTQRQRTGLELDAEPGLDAGVGVVLGAILVLLRRAPLTVEDELRRLSDRIRDVQRPYRVDRVQLADAVGAPAHDHLVRGVPRGAQQLALHTDGVRVPRAGLVVNVATGDLLQLVTVAQRHVGTGHLQGVVRAHVGGVHRHVALAVPDRIPPLHRIAGRQRQRIRGGELDRKRSRVAMVLPVRVVAVVLELVLPAVRLGPLVVGDRVLLRLDAGAYRPGRRQGVVLNR